MIFGVYESFFLFFLARDYCCSLLYGIPDSVISMLQRASSKCLRLPFVCCLPKSYHITPVVHGLHWLPVTVRACDFIVLLITFYVLHDLTPPKRHNSFQLPSRPTTIFAALLTMEFYFSIFEQSRIELFA